MDKIHNKNNSLSYTKYNEALLSLYFIKNFNTNNTYKPYKKIQVIAWNAGFIAGQILRKHSTYSLNLKTAN